MGEFRGYEANLHVMFTNTICWSHLFMFVEITGNTDDNSSWKMPTNQDVCLRIPL